MKKVIVVTFYKRNYGAFLQAYALQNYLISIGYEAEVLNYNYFQDRTILGVYIGEIKRPLYFVKNIAYKLIRYRVSKKRDNLMNQCAEKMIRQTKCFKNYKSLKKDVPQADIYMVGSDQVWNPHMAEQGLLSRLLEFASDKENVLCSYAASLGVNSFSPKMKELFRSHLQRFDCISVREQKAAEIIGRLTDKRINIHKDPTLLLSKDEWDAFAMPVTTGNPYVFLYLAQNSNDLVEYAIRIAKENHWGIVDCHSSANYSVPDCINGDRTLSPMEFVGGIRGASYVVTNSFHCLVFSIHYKKKAFVQLPPKGAARLSELINGMRLERLLDGKLILDEESESIYRYVTEFVENEQIAAKKFFMNLEIILQDKRNI